MIKEGKFPVIKEADLRLYKETFKFSPKGEMKFNKGQMDFSKGKVEGVITKPKREVNVGTMPKKEMNVGTMPKREVDMGLKKAGYPGKLKVVDNIFKGSLDY